MRKFGAYTDLTNEEYHADKDFVSRSGIVDFARSPYNYWAKHINPKRPVNDPTISMILGTAFHTMILEPEIYDTQYMIMPEPVLLKNVGRERYDAYKQQIAECESSTKILLDWKSYNTLREMRDVFMNNETAVQLIKDARIEHSFFWQDKDSGLLLKARPDIFHDNMIVDLKTTSDASPRAFQYDMAKYGYHIQHAMCRDAIEATLGFNICNFINVVVETKYPYNMAIYMIEPEAIERGQMRYKQVCINLKQSLTENKFVDYGIQQVSLPNWAV